MLVVPALVLPRDDELEILGRTVEQTLGRSVSSIDVIGRGFTVLCLAELPLTPIRSLPRRPTEQGKTHRVASSRDLHAHDISSFLSVCRHSPSP